MSEYAGKKLLILAGAGPHCKVVDAAKEMGVYTIVTDYLKDSDSPAKIIADESWMLNIMDVDAIVEKCKSESIDAVLNFCIDPAQKPYQQICERLGLPCIGNSEQFHIFTDKLTFKRKCIECGVDVIPEYTVEDIHNGKVQYPVLIKPAESRGSRGQTICYSRQEVEGAVSFAEKESSNQKIVIEKYMGGKPDFSMAYLVADGVPYLVRTADRHLGDRSSGMDRQTVTSISPSRFTEMCLKNVDKRVSDFIKTLGIKNGPVLMQGFIDGSTIRFYDMGLRFPGNEYERLYTYATNMNLMKSMIKFALGEGVDTFDGNLSGSYNLNGHRILQIMVNIVPGEISEVQGIDAVMSHPDVIDLQQRHFAGDVISASGDIKQRACEVDILIKDDNRIEEMISYIQNTIKYIDTNGNNMCIHIDANAMGEFYRNIS